MGKDDTSILDDHRKLSPISKKKKTCLKSHNLVKSWNRYSSTLPAKSFVPLPSKRDRKCCTNICSSAAFSSCHRKGLCLGTFVFPYFPAQIPLLYMEYRG